jgi:hypothetical protein
MKTKKKNHTIVIERKMQISKVDETYCVLKYNIWQIEHTSKTILKQTNWNQIWMVIYKVYVFFVGMFIWMVIYKVYVFFVGMFIWMVIYKVYVFFVLFCFFLFFCFCCCLFCFVFILFLLLLLSKIHEGNKMLLLFRLEISNFPPISI